MIPLEVYWMNHEWWIPVVFRRVHIVQIFETEYIKMILSQVGSSFLAHFMPTIFYAHLQGRLDLDAEAVQGN